MKSIFNNSNFIFYICLTMIFIILFCVFTFPLCLKLTSAIPGFQSSDESFETLWYSWRIRYSLVHHLSLVRSDFIAHPFGIAFYGSGVLSYLWLVWTHALNILFNPPLFYNIQVFSNSLLCALFTFFLVFSLTKNKASAVFSSLIFTFCPYQFVRIWQHLSLTYNQWLILVLYMAILLKVSYTKRIAIAFFVSLLLLLSFDFTIMYLGMIVLLSFFIYVLAQGLISKFTNKGDILKADFIYFKRIFLVGIVAFLVTLPQFLPIIMNILHLQSGAVASAHNTFLRPFEDLFAQSARPLSYFLPATSHPIFGKFTEQFIGTSLYGVSLTEHTLYLGWVPMLLAFYAVKRWWRQKKADKRPGTVPCGNSPLGREYSYIGYFVFLTAVAWLFSQPPWWQIGPLKIYMPSFFMYKILPMFRAYCRFGIVVMLAVSVLAGFGLKLFLERFKSRKARIVLTVIFSGLVLFEFWNWPPYKVIDVSKVPNVYYWLKSQPEDFVIAEFPLDYASQNEMYKFYQTIHEKKIINGTVPFTYANKVAGTIKKLSEPETAGVLKWMGVKYVIVHRDRYLDTDLVDEIEELKSIPKNKGLKLVKSFPAQNCPDKDIMCVQKIGPIDVYELDAGPIKPAVKEQ